MKRLLALVAVLAIAAPVSAATVDGMRIQSAVAGAGNQTVILVHGWTCDSSSWDAQVPVLARKYRVITIDLPGHGKSDSPKDGKFSMDLFARAVEAVRAEAKVDKVVLVGHSMGAPVIRQYARRFPRHVAGLDSFEARPRFTACRAPLRTVRPRPSSPKPAAHDRATIVHSHSGD